MEISLFLCSRRPFIQNASKVPINFLLIHLRCHIICPGNHLLVKGLNVKRLLLVQGESIHHSGNLCGLWSPGLLSCGRPDLKASFQIFLARSSWVLEVLSVSPSNCLWKQKPPIWVGGFGRSHFYSLTILGLDRLYWHHWNHWPRREATFPPNILCLFTL